MKNGKLRKALLTICSALVLVGLTAGVTVAYLTSTDSVTNTFTVGAGVTIALDEAQTGTDGVAVTPAKRVQANTYELTPGHTYVKDPTVHVKGQDCYVFVTVTNGIANIEADTTIANQMAAKGWKVVDASKNLYVYAADNDTKTAVSGTDAKPTDLVVFENFTVKTTETQTSLADYANKTIVINAYAVQKDGFENSTPAEIWAATFGATPAPTTNPGN